MKHTLQIVPQATVFAIFAGTFALVLTPIVLFAIATLVAKLFD